MNYFLKVLQLLRTEEQVLLYDNILSITPRHEADSLHFLRTEYAQESLNYPYSAPPLDEKAAIWAAKFIYTAAQLMLYRENKSEELSTLLPDFQGKITPSSILSADLTLRFLPLILIHLKTIDPEDPLNAILEKQLSIWHYSALGSHLLQTEELSFETIRSNDCLYHLYLDRVIERKVEKLALLPELKDGIKEHLGIHANIFWKELTITNNQ